MSDDEEHDEYMGAELYAAERHAEAAESLLRDAVIRADAAEKRVAVLEEALRFFFDLMETGKLRRNIDSDDDPAWAIEWLEIMRRMAEIKATLPDSP